MDFAVPTARRPLHGEFAVPPSKSLHQRALVLRALAEGTSEVVAGPGEVGRDVRCLAEAVARLGTWTDGALGPSRDRLVLDLGEGATGFRFATALAALRRDGARTLVRGAPSLLARPHGDLVRALGRLGGRAKRRRSGAIRVLGGGLCGAGLRGGEVVLSGSRSSQYASALLLVAPRIGGIAVRFAGRPVSAPYLGLTAEALAAFGVPCALEGLGGAGGTARVPAVAPVGTRYVVPPDASAAAAWWAAAALTGGSAAVPGLSRGSSQADAALLPVLERMGCRVEERRGAALVHGPSGGLDSPSEVVLTDSPDLLPLLAVLAARARGTTRIVGVAHARLKETDRVGTVARALGVLGGRVETSEDGLEVREAPLRGGTVDVRGDHRLAFAFGVLGLVVPGIVLHGAESTGKSHPGFLADLVRASSDGAGVDG